MTDNAVMLEVLRDLLRTRGEVVVGPSGFSMGGAYRRVEGLVLRPAPAHIRVGDVVAVVRGERWALHRVLGCRGDWFLTKGDAVADFDDPPARRDQVEAVLVARVIGGQHLPERRLAAWWYVARGWLQWAVKAV